MDRRAGAGAELEARISGFLGTEATQLYSSCFDANGGVFELLLGEQDAIISDALNHASIIDGVRLCKAKRYLYEHADMADLEAKLREAASARFRMIVTDGVFSMDGDVADIDGDGLEDIVSLATTPERWEMLKAEKSRFQTMNMETHLISPEEIKKLAPITDVKDVIGGLYDEFEGYSLHMDVESYR